jgi:hypothetical protein
VKPSIPFASRLRRALDSTRVRSQLAVVAACGAVGAVGLSSSRTLAWRDTADLYGPLRGLVTASLRSGRLPLWNPYEGLGKPLFAEGIHGVLHPFSLIAAWIAPSGGVDALVRLWMLAGGLGTWWLARELGAGEWGAAAAGFAYGLSGYALGQISNLVYLAGAGSLPWVVAAAHRAGRRLRWGVPVLAIAVAAMAYAGDFESLGLGIVLAAGVATASGGWRGLARAVTGIACGLALAAPQLWPSWVHFDQRTTRAFGLSEENRLQWALAPPRLLEFVAPGFFGGATGAEADPVFRALGGPSPHFSLPFCPSIFVGAPVLILAALGARHSRTSRWLALAAGVLLWASMGRALGAEQLFQGVPLWNRFRYPEKLLGAWTLCVAVLCGLGVKATGASVPRWAGLAARVSFLSSAAGAGLFLLFPAAGTSLLSAAGGAATLARERLGWGLLMSAVGVGGAALLLAARAHREVLLAGLVLAQTAAAAPHSLHWGPRADFLSPRLPPLTADGPVRLETPIREGEAAEGEDPMGRNTRLGNELGKASLNVAARVDNIDLYGPFYPIRHEALWLKLGDTRWRGFRRYAATHLLLPAATPESALLRDAAAGAAPLGISGDVRAFAIPHRPWAFFADRAVAIQDRTATLGEVLSRVAAEDATVVVQTDRPPSLAPGRVLAAQRGTEEVSIDAESEGDALLVVNDAYWPGWEAEVDGAPIPLWPADVLVRAMPFPAGHHRLVMRYRPPELRAALAAGGGGLLFLAALLFLELRSRRRPLEPA